MAYLVPTHVSPHFHKWAFECEFFISWYKYDISLMHLAHNDNFDICVNLDMSKQTVDFGSVDNLERAWESEDISRWVSVLQKAQTLLRDGFHYTPYDDHDEVGNA